MKVSLRIAIAVLLLSGCSSEQKETDNPQSQKVITFHVPESDYTIPDIDSFVTSVSFIPIAKEASASLNWIQHFFVVEDGNIILVDEDAKIIVKIDPKGNLLWEIKGRYDDFRYFDEIFECEYNPYKKEVVVYNPFGGNKEFIYNLSGQPVTTGSQPVSYHQQYFLSEEDIVYSTQGLVNSAGAGPGPSTQITWKQNDTIKGYYIDQTPHFPRYNFFVAGYSEFDVLNGKLHYHATFTDTFYSINFPEQSPLADFVIEFNANDRTADYLRDARIKNKLRHAMEQRSPLIIHAANDGKQLPLVYQKGRELYTALYDINKNDWLFNAQVLRYQGRTFRAPRLYYNGYFLRPMYRYQLEYLAQFRDQEEIPADYLDKLRSLEDEHGDGGEMVLCLIKL